MAEDRKVHMHVTQDMYQMALMALHGMQYMDLATATFSMAGSRKDWRAIVSLFEDAAKDHDCHVNAIRYVTIFDDDTATASIVVSEDPKRVH